MERRYDVVEKWGELVDSVVALLETAAEWFQQQVETTVRDKVAKPLVVAIVAGSAGAAALAGFTFFSIGLLIVGLAWALSYLIGPAWASLVVGAVLLGGAALVVLMVIRTVRRA